MFQDIITCFLQKLKELSHLTPLLPQRNLILKLSSEKTSFLLSVSEKGLHLKKVEYEEDLYDISIKGSETSICRLIMGHAKLTRLIKTGEITAEGSYRNILLLESIFYLGKNSMNREIAI